MADPASCLPLEASSIQAAYEKIKSYIHQTPLLSSKSLNAIASHHDPVSFLSKSPPTLSYCPRDGPRGSAPIFKLYFKCENQQKIGAFKARGAFHALTHLITAMGIEAVRKRGVITHSSGNHAQALALAAHTFQIPSYIIMPTISTPSKIAGTRLYTDNVIFSGSTSDEREAKVVEVQEKTGAILVPPYDHPDIILGQGTAAMEMESQLHNLTGSSSSRFDAVLTPLGGGGLLSGTATWFSRPASSSSSSFGGAETITTPSSSSPSTPAHKDKKTLVFGAEPSFSGANDAQIGLSKTPPTRVPHVKSLTIADGLRTPVGHIPWTIISDKTKLEGVYSVNEDEIKMALRLVLERLKVFVEPSAVVPLAVVLFCPEFRDFVAERQLTEAKASISDTVGSGNNGGSSEIRPWNVGIIFSGGNTTVEALATLFSYPDNYSNTSSRPTAQIGLDGSRKVEDVAG